MPKEAYVITINAPAGANKQATAQDILEVLQGAGFQVQSVNAWDSKGVQVSKVKA